MRPSFPLLAFLLSLLAGAAHAEGSGIGLQTPSKNIGCQFFATDGRATLRCDILETSAAMPPRPADCEGEWGHSFEMEVKGTVARICAGDTIIDPSLPLLPYGEVWQAGGFTCRSDEAGLTCFNAVQHGFSLSRSTLKVF